jgi:hypothetical protein
MGRPYKNGLDFFYHDVNASGDPKIESLLMLYGIKGYGFYFLHLEYIYRGDESGFNVSDPETRQILCKKMSITEQEYDNMLATCLKHSAFDKQHYDKTGCLTSNGIRKKFKFVIDKRDRMNKLNKRKRGVIDEEK